MGILSVAIVRTLTGVKKPCGLRWFEFAERIGRFVQNTVFGASQLPSLNVGDVATLDELVFPLLLV